MQTHCQPIPAMQCSVWLHRRYSCSWCVLWFNPQLFSHQFYLPQ